MDFGHGLLTPTNS